MDGKATPRSDYKILLVEDEAHMVATIELLLGAQYSLRAAGSVAEAKQMLQTEWPDLVLLDLGLPDEPGTSLLKHIRQKDAQIDVVVVTVVTDVAAAVQVMKLGAKDYIQKPFEKEELLLCVQQAYEHWKLTREVHRLRSELYDSLHFRNIIANSPQMLEVVAIAQKVARSDAAVLITGPSGTGKELIARAIHCDGVRSEGPFVAVNCAQFSGSLLESELFGHEKGAFTGAAGLRKGRFELASGGTLFLDEIGNTSLEMQAKILRAVETKRFERVGGEKTIQGDFRLIAATNTNLEEAVRKGTFREDLYYRLNVVRIDVPPLCERKEDIEPLCKDFLARYCAKTGRHLSGITPEAMDLLRAYDWRGNVRELHNVIEMSLTLEEGTWITTRCFPQHILSSGSREGRRLAGPANVLQRTVQNFERRFLQEQLRMHGWNRRELARQLGVHRNTIENKIAKYDIREDD